MLSSFYPCAIQARDVYEEAIQTVVTVRDFTQVFDSYAQFEESMIAAKMETTSEMGKDEDGEDSFPTVRDNVYFQHMKAVSRHCLPALFLSIHACFPESYAFDTEVTLLC